LKKVYRNNAKIHLELQFYSSCSSFIFKIFIIIIVVIIVVYP